MRGLCLLHARLLLQLHLLLLVCVVSVFLFDLLFDLFDLVEVLNHVALGECVLFLCEHHRLLRAYGAHALFCSSVFIRVLVYRDVRRVAERCLAVALRLGVSKSARLTGGST